MAKSVRATNIKRNKTLKLKKMQPMLAEQDRKRQVRLTSYMALAKARKAEKDGEELTFTEEEQAAADHAKELERNDEQKRRLRDNGHFFFVHPYVKKDEVFPVVSNPDGKVEPYQANIDPADKNVKFNKKELYKLNKLRKKTSRSKRRSNLEKNW